MLQQVISNHLPETWDAADYNGTTYELFPVNENSTEYNTVVGPFAGLAVEKVHRLQNPYMLGRFKLRKEQLQNTRSVGEVRMYYPIDANDVDTVAEYNCDYRRCNQSGRNAQNSGKKAKFYPSPLSAKETYRAYVTGKICIVATRVQEGSTTSSVYKDWDTEYIPEYFVFLEN